MNSPQTLLDTNLMAMLIMAGCAFLGLVFTIISFWVRFNVKIKEIEMAQDIIRDNNKAFDQRLLLIETNQKDSTQQYNLMLTNYAIINERQTTMTQKIERILTILEKQEKQK